MEKRKATAPQPPVRKTPIRDAGGIPEQNAPGLRETKIRRQRQQLIEIAVELFCAKGFDATLIAEIVRGAEVSERTFFRYFKTKEELAFDWNDKHGRLALAILAAGAKHESPTRTMKRTLLQLADAIDGDREKCARMVRLIFDSPTLEARAYYEIAKWGNVFISTLQQGRYLSAADNFKLQVVVTITVNAFVFAVRSWAHDARPGSFRPWIESAIALV